MATMIVILRCRHCKKIIFSLSSVHASKEDVTEEISATAMARHYVRDVLGLQAEVTEEIIDYVKRGGLLSCTMKEI